jgi:Zn-dependent metalloprotease
MSQRMPGVMAAMARSPAAKKQRLIYDATGGSPLPGTLVRSEGQGKSSDVAVNEVYDHSGDTYDFYYRLFKRNSLDNAGMTLTSSVHVNDETGSPLSNAFWNGSQMAYGDGDGTVFRRFTGALDVVAHELTHGVQSYASNLTYQGESGALNEHFADVFGVLVRQWKRGEKAEKANWLIGAELLVPAATRRALRDMENPGTAFQADPDLGSDPQPGHLQNLYTGTFDRGGVHINSGIPNRAFVLVAKRLKGNAFDTAGAIWYAAMEQLTSTSVFIDCAKLTVQIAGADHGAAAKRAVSAAWKKVGITV